ncbi:hypothetical protein GCM10022409_19370 [Hymenobacter glaciei]|uniref:Secretion system C-terminal sorting domain-containing protein n=1 Tax=Hymenobacter glaciei TaxID=877209 RepID=A0ABP7U2R6_9BACT
MKNHFTLSAIAALALSSLGAQAQFTVDGTLSTAEVGTGTGKYQLVGTYTGAHNITDRGLKALYMGTTATTLNIMVVASAEISPVPTSIPQEYGYNSLLLFLDAPNKTGIAARTKLPGSNNTGNDGRESLRQRPTLDMETDYAFRCTTSPLGDQPGAIYLSRVDYTVPAIVNNPDPTKNGYPEIGMGAGKKDGSVTVDANDPAMVKSAYKTSGPTGSVAANTSTGWEIEIPLSYLGGAAAGSDFRTLVAYIDDFKSFNADVLPMIVGRTTALGIDPDFTAIPGNQFYSYRVGQGVLGNRAATADALAATTYPNPLTSASRLSYTIASGTQPVSVDVYNALGQRVLNLLNADQGAGLHTAELAPLQKLAVGSYLVKLQVGSQLTSRRVVVE